MSRSMDDLATFLKTRHRGMASLVAAAMVLNGLVAVSKAIAPGDDPAATAIGSTFDREDGVVNEDGTITLSDGTVVRPDGTVVSTPGGSGGAKGAAERAKKNAKKLTDIGVLGVSDDEIQVVYYWKGERTMASPFIGGTAAEGQNLDEALAFNHYLDFINKHANGTAEFMGVKINLHGRKLVGRVLEAGNGDYSYAETAEKIASEIKPFAAISSHGGLSTYICPRLAETGVFNLSSYDLGGSGGTLHQRSNGFCTPSGITWERQVDFTVAYLKEHMKTTTTLGEKPLYGVLYSLYPGMEKAGPRMIKKLKDAGIPIAHDAKIPADLATSQQQMPGIVNAFRGKFVNTIIMPEANSPLNFTHAAQANGYNPDYYVWPCSGQDSAAMVRLFSGAQWERAAGLTCYDAEYNPDITNADRARDSIWYKQYQEVAGASKEPPSPAPIVYSSLSQLVAGISGAGRDLNPASFKAALARFKPYRYDMIDGRTSDRTNMLISLGASDRTFIGDVAKLEWSTIAREAGQTAQGQYVYLEDRRYTKPSQL